MLHLRRWSSTLEAPLGPGTRWTKYGAWRAVVAVDIEIAPEFLDANVFLEMKRLIRRGLSPGRGGDDPTSAERGGVFEKKQAELRCDVEVVQQLAVMDKENDKLWWRCCWFLGVVSAYSKEFVLRQGWNQLLSWAKEPLKDLSLRWRRFLRPCQNFCSSFGTTFPVLSFQWSLRRRSRRRFFCAPKGSGLSLAVGWFWSGDLKDGLKMFLKS